MQAESLNSYERTPVSDETRRLLMDFAAADFDRPLSRVDADWQEVFQAVCRHGLLHIAHAYLARQTDYPPPEFRTWIEDQYRVSHFYAILTHSWVAEALDELAQSGINFMVVKGPALAHLIYPDPMMRPFNDLDIIVREHDRSIVQERLIDLGYLPLEGGGPPPHLTAQQVTYESQYQHPQRKFLIEVHYDDILNAGFRSRDLDGFWERAGTVEIADVSVRCMSLEDQVVHLCAHAHYHGYTRLNWLTDIVLLIRNSPSPLDWSRVVLVARTEEAQVSTYYSLYFVRHMLDQAIPQQVLDDLRPDFFRRFWHERLMPEDKVMSLEPMWRPDFSFYFSPLLKRLLPDLLVMGRRREKLICLARLLVPPAAWLRFYYDLDESDSVGLHYLLHPVKLAFHYSKEIVSAVFRRPIPPDFYEGS